MTANNTAIMEKPQTDRTAELISLAQQGDRDTLDLLVRENTGLIWSVVRKFMHRGYEADDLFQIGSIGLIKCIGKFDMSYNVRFSTYAVPMIIGEIKRFIRDDGMIKVSRPLKEMAAKARYMQERMLQRDGKTPTVSELADAIGTEVGELVMAMDACREVESLYSTVNSGSDGAAVYLIDKLDRSQQEESNIVDIIALKQIITRLGPKERRVIVMRYFRDKTQAETARVLGVSQVQVSRIEKKVLGAIREQMLS